MQQNRISPDDICNRVIGAKLNMYRAKEHYESAIKEYNDSVDQLMDAVRLMQDRIVALQRKNNESTQSDAG